MVKSIFFTTVMIWGGLFYSAQACFEDYESFSDSHSQSIGVGRPIYYFKPLLNKDLTFFLEKYQLDFTVAERPQSDFPAFRFYDVSSEEFDDRSATYIISDGVIKYYQIFEQKLPYDVCVNQAFIAEEIADKTYREGYLNINVSVPEGYAVAYYEKRSRQQMEALVVLKLKDSSALPISREVMISQIKVPLSLADQTKLRLEQYVNANLAAWVDFDRAYLESIE